MLTAFCKIAMYKHCVTNMYYQALHYFVWQSCTNIVWPTCTQHVHIKPTIVPTLRCYVWLPCANSVNLSHTVDMKLPVSKAICTCGMVRESVPLTHHAVDNINSWCCATHTPAARWSVWGPWVRVTGGYPASCTHRGSHSTILRLPGSGADWQWSVVSGQAGWIQNTHKPRNLSPSETRWSKSRTYGTRQYLNTNPWPQIRHPSKC